MTSELLIFQYVRHHLQLVQHDCSTYLSYTTCTEDLRADSHRANGQSTLPIIESSKSSSYDSVAARSNAEPLDLVDHIHPTLDNSYSSTPEAALHGVVRHQL